MPDGTPPNRPSSSPFIGTYDVILLGALGLLWGSAYIFIREGIVLGASPLAFADVRYIFSAAAFALLAAVRGEARPERRAVLVSAGIGGVLFIGLYGGLLYWGEQYTTGGYASVLAATAPVLTVVAAYALLPNERLSPLSLVGILLGFVGVIVLVLPELAGSPIGSVQGPVYIVGAFLCTAVGAVALRRVGGGRQGLWQLGVQFAVGSLVLSTGVVVLPVPEALPLTAAVWAALAALVVFSSVMGYFVYFTLHHRVGPVRANVVAYILPLVGVGIGTGFFGEPTTWWEAAGFLVVVVGVTLILREGMRRESTASSGTR